MRKTSAFAVFAAVSLATSAAGAFCGFYISGADTKLYNNATQVVLMRDGTRTVLSMQNNYQGPPNAFAMVVPVPVVLQKENVKTLAMNVFDKIDQLDSPRLVEYWEQDPCRVPVPEEHLAFASGGGGGGGGPDKKGDLGVKIEAQFTVGEYEIVILSAQDSTGLDTWLRREKYAIPAGAAPYLDPYVKAGSKFFVAKVDPKKVKFENGAAALSPLRFHYDTTDFSLPVRLGLINSKDVQDLIVHVLAKGQRYEVSNYENVTIPTNIDVGENVKGQFATFYASLFDETVKQHPKAVITEYAWDASTCDPCPGPALDGSDIATFGGDALVKAEESEKKRAWGIGGWVITRLHARYDKNALGADLVFKAAPAIVGGREWVADGGKLERGSKPDTMNNFQGRYAIRHPWTGEIKCEHPVRGVWGGPPAGVNAEPTKGARNLAFAPRGAQLTSFLKSDVPELSIAQPATSSAPVPLTIPSAAPPAKSGCAGCDMSGTNAGSVGLIGLVALLLRKRSKK